LNNGLSSADGPPFRWPRVVHILCRLSEAKPEVEAT